MSSSLLTSFNLSKVFRRGLALGLTLPYFLGCGGSNQLSDAEKQRLALCKPVLARHEFDETPFRGGKANILSFQGIRARVNTACSGCHMVPAATGGFAYLDEYQGLLQTINGETKWRPGFSDLAEKMRDYINHPDPKKRMPPEAQRSKNPDAILEVGRQLDAWIKAGKPTGTFEAGKSFEDRRGKLRPTQPHATSDLGDCVPVAKAVGTDFEKDRMFEKANSLPKYLTDTDIFTLDPLALAQKGTLAYNVEYPLWADNAEKGRWIHVPMVLKDGALQKQSIDIDSVSGQFRIPDNTRFYKSFYRPIKLPNGRTRMRRMETRIIVARTPWEKSLFGTYQWDETEQIATLVDAPYLDGTPFKDVDFEVFVEEGTNKTRPYAIPGRERCIDCHRGGPTNNMVLGFNPLQINKRPLGGGGRADPAAEHDLNQVARFISYGLLSGIKSADELPVLERSGGLPPTNVYELRANGYTVGNCSHCHNINGLAAKAGIYLELGAGKLFQFDTSAKSVDWPGRKLVHQAGDLDASVIWLKISAPPEAQGIYNMMPMHSPGSPDCRALTYIGQWLRSFESPRAAEEFDPKCKKETEWNWIPSDFTQVEGGVYVPRRNDWQNTNDGMPVKYRQLELTPSLKQTILTEYPVGYWQKKPECKFPEVNLPVEKQLKWMLKEDGTPKKPFGELYYATPGSYFFRTTCFKCHGHKADGDSDLARGILNWSGGKVRVANLANGLFGNSLQNLKTFDWEGKNYGGNYLVWMAMEGTRVKFPEALEPVVGKHGGRMLNGIRDKCLMQISIEKASSPRFVDHEIFNRVCFMENLYPGHPDLEYDQATSKPKHPAKVEEWADRAAWNAGWAIYEFLHDAIPDRWPARLEQCEMKYGPPPVPTPQTGTPNP